MLVSLIKGNKIKQLRLPNKVIGNYCITDYEDNNEIKLINIEALNGKWYLVSNEYVSVVENGHKKGKWIISKENFEKLKKINSDLEPQKSAYLNNCNDYKISEAAKRDKSRELTFKRNDFLKVNIITGYKEKIKLCK